MHTYKWKYLETDDLRHPRWYFVVEATEGNNETTILIQDGVFHRVWVKYKNVGFPRNPPMGVDYV